MTTPDDFADRLKNALQYTSAARRVKQTNLSSASSSSDADSDTESDEDSQKLISDDDSEDSDEDSSEFKTDESESVESSKSDSDDDDDEESVQPQKKPKVANKSDGIVLLRDQFGNIIEVDAAKLAEIRAASDAAAAAKKKETAEKEAAAKKKEEKEKAQKKEEKKPASKKEEKVSKKEEKPQKKEEIPPQKKAKKEEQQLPDAKSPLPVTRVPASPTAASIIEQAIIQKAQMPRAVLKVETVARFMAKSSAHTQVVLASLLLAYSKSAKLADLSAAALAARPESGVVLAFDASSKKKRIAAVRKNFVQGLQQRQLAVPPCTASEDELLSTKEITGADFSDDESMNDASRQTRMKALEAMRAEAKALNDERKEAFEKLDQHERAKIEITGLEYLREKMLSHVKATSLLPYVPTEHVGVSFDNATVAAIFHNTQKRAYAALFLGKEDYDTFYSPYVMHRLLSQRADCMPADVIAGAGLVDLLSLGFYLTHKLAHEIGKATKNQPGGTKLLDALGEALYFNDSVETKEALLTRIFCWSPPAGWLACEPNPVWLELHKTLPNRDVMRTGSRSVKPLFECVAACTAPKFDVANTDDPNLDAPDEHLRFSDKSKKKPAAAAVAKQELKKIAVVEPKAAVESAPAPVPESASEARIDARLFFVSPYAPDAKFDKLRNNTALVAIEKTLDDAVPIRSKEAASKVFSVMAQEAGTTSAQMAVDDVDADEAAVNVDHLVQGDLRRIDVLARRANVPALAIRNEIARVADPDAFARLLDDFPDLSTLSASDLAKTVLEAKKLREETRTRTNTTKKSAINQVSQRVHKPADGLLTRVVADSHKSEHAAADDNSALGDTTSSHAWLNGKIIEAAGASGAFMVNAELVTLATELLGGAEFCDEQRMKIVEFRARFSAMCKHTIAEMHKHGKLFCSAQDSALLEDPARLLRKTTNSAEFQQWMAQVCVMANSLDILYELATCTTDKSDAAAKLALVQHLPNKDFSPLVAWKN